MPMYPPKVRTRQEMHNFAIFYFAGYLDILDLVAS